MSKKLNPHNLIHNNKDGTWTCHYCGETAPLEELQQIECTYEYPPCEYCGQTPECAPDCSGILGALQGAIDSDDVHVSGIEPEDKDTIH